MYLCVYPRGLWILVAEEILGERNVSRFSENLDRKGVSEVMRGELRPIYRT